MNKVCLKENLNLLIGKHGRSLSRVAQSVGMNKSTLHGYLNGILPKSLETIIKLAEVLEVEPENLLFSDISRSTKKECKAHYQRFEITVRSLDEGE